MRLWVTRSQPGAARTAKALADLGHQAVVQPVLEVETLGGAVLDLTNVAAIAFTSGQAVAAFAALSPRRDIPTYVTGQATAADARAAGFAEIVSADGDAGDLATVILASTPGPVIWPCAADPARDLAALLAQRGVSCRAVPLYRTVQSQAPAPGGLDGVLIHSARAAEAVARALNGQDARGLCLFALSPAAARPLESLAFGRVAIAPRPDETAMLALIAG